MKKKIYEVEVKRTEYGRVDVVAGSEDEAMIMSQSAIAEGRAHWNKELVEIQKITLVGDKEE